MEDIFEDFILDIDGCDEKNFFVVIDYVDEFYFYYRKMEVIFLLNVVFVVDFRYVELQI